MKPILVTNQADWQRLAPVLERQGIVYIGSTKPTNYVPARTPMICHFSKPSVVYATDITVRCGKTQSVDEYLASVQDSEAVIMRDINGKPFSFSLAQSEFDYKAKYEALSKAVREAIGLMTECKEMAWQSYKDSDNENKKKNAIAEEYAFKRSLEILTEKTQGI